MSERPVRFVDGIGPPLCQIEDDCVSVLKESNAESDVVSAQDTLALIAEIYRLDVQVASLRKDVVVLSNRAFG